MKKAEKWTSYEIGFLRSNYRSMTDLELSIHFQRPISGIRKQRYNRNLIRKNQYEMTVNRKKSKPVIIERMKDLAYIIQFASTAWQKEKYSVELRKLSGL